MVGKKQKDKITTSHDKYFDSPSLPDRNCNGKYSSANSVETFKSWYELCFEPMQPPQITWQELLPSLLVYRCIQAGCSIIHLFVLHFSLTFALGVSGNILIILTVKRKSSFKSPTNTFLASLATTDLLLIVLCLPIKVRDSHDCLLKPNPFSQHIELIIYSL